MNEHGFVFPLSDEHEFETIPLKKHANPTHATPSLRGEYTSICLDRKADVCVQIQTEREFATTPSYTHVLNVYSG